MKIYYTFGEKKKKKEEERREEKRREEKRREEKRREEKRREEKRREEKRREEKKRGEESRGEERRGEVGLPGSSWASTLSISLILLVSERTLSMYSIANGQDSAPGGSLHTPSQSAEANTDSSPV
ncbi:hypothetical protein Baya_9368 [Bagarius yarrelli]|uniref:Uncharacterized protein n=1 Tax=Bagarius yarrelli TaxID=175774 RepID=A0A556U677_BAGYA|nr:hypothetical protein Baya_9368 [Bagarius yarrelli]